VSQPINAAVRMSGIRGRIPTADGLPAECDGGLGLSANYSHTVVSARSSCERTSRLLLRDAPNTWNISPTYDTKRFSMRVGMTYHDPIIYSYQYQNLAYATDANGNPI
jgi:hypothetical protein